MPFLLFPSIRRSRHVAARPIATSSRDWRCVEVIRELAVMFAEFSDATLKSRAQELQLRLHSARLPVDELSLSNAFALMTEAVRRTTGKSFYDVQLLGGLSLARGEIAEMQTGEGKTLTTALPAFYFSLTGQGVHIATTNSYLAARDCAELRPAFERLGVTVGLLPEEHDAGEKLKAYRCDVTFGTGYEFGFDFLRDQIAIRQQPRMPLGLRHLTRMSGGHLQEPVLLQRGHAFAIIDEADSVLIDEATMPLVLSGFASDQGDEQHYQLAARVAESLRVEEHYRLNDATRNIRFTKDGWTELHEPLRQSRLRGLRRSWAGYIEHALRAKHYLQRDVDYVVLDETVQIVDQHTGRIHAERTWRDGLHQSVEVREQVPVSPERTCEGRISRQRYFQFYGQVTGMTGTAAGNEREFREFYDLPVCVIPTHAPGQRQHLPTRFFATDQARDAAITAEVLDCHKRGQPVLIGTRTIRHSRQLADRLLAAGVKQALLNGTQDEEEASIISRAGQLGAVTIATNMAGRGTDIRIPDDALHTGGLHVIAAEHHASQRVDRQLAGRAARQGNPGSVRFYVAASDEIFMAAESSLPERIREVADDDGEARTNLEAEVAKVQRQLEQTHFERRRDMVNRDNWMESILDTLARQA